MKKTLELTSILFLFIFFTACETQTTCDISGPGLACPGETFEYVYESDIANPDVDWSSTNGITLVSEGTSSATFTFPTGFTTGSISASGAGSETCSETIQIFCDGGPPPPPQPCSPPVPVIDPQVCVSGGHPHWRFQLNGISSSDQTNWSIDYGEISGVTADNYAIVIPAGTFETQDYFTVYCEVTRICPDGSTVQVTAYWTSQYGNSCAEGTGGILD